MAKQELELNEVSLDSLMGGEWNKGKKVFNWPKNTWIPPPDELTHMAINAYVVEAKDGKEPINEKYTEAVAKQLDAQAAQLEEAGLMRDAHLMKQDAIRIRLFNATFDKISTTAHGGGYMQKDIGKSKWNPVRRFPMVDQAGNLQIGKSPKDAPAGQTWTFIHPQFQAEMCRACIDPMRSCSQELVNKCVQIKLESGKQIWCIKESHLFNYTKKMTCWQFIELIVYQLMRDILKEEQEVKQKQREAEQKQASAATDDLVQFAKAARLSMIQQPSTRPSAPIITENKEVQTVTTLSGIPDKQPAAPPVLSANWKRLGAKGRKLLEGKSEAPKPSAPEAPQPAQFADAEEKEKKEAIIESEVAAQ